MKLQKHNYLGSNKDPGSGKPRLERKIHMSSENKRVVVSQEHEEKKSVLLAVNSASALRQRTKRETGGTLEPENMVRKTDRENFQSGQKSFYEPKTDIDYKTHVERNHNTRQTEKFVKEKLKQNVWKDNKFHSPNSTPNSGPAIKTKNYEYGFKDKVTFTRMKQKSDTVSKEEGYQRGNTEREEKDTLKTRKKDDKISSKGEGQNKRIKKEQEHTHTKKAIRRRMLAYMVNKLTEDQQKDSLAKTVKDIALMRAGLVVKQLIFYLLGLLGPLLSGLVTIALPFILIIVILYNTPIALFLPPLQEGDTVQSVLSQYYQEFNAEIREAEEETDQTVTYKNMQNGVSRSNFMDVMMVYVVRFGTGQGNFSTVMNDKNKERLKEIFDEMNHFASETVTDTVRVGESLGVMTFSAYCNCSICCGQWAGGPTASGVMPKENHTLAVDAYNPTLPMGTHIIAGGQEYVVEDTGNFDRYGVDFDMYFGDHQTAQDFGHQDMEVFLADSNGSNTVEVTHTSLYVYNLSYEDYIDLGKLTPSQEKLLRQVMSDEFLQSMPASGIGEQVALSAMDKVGCQYSQDRRYEEGYYDCSSLVQRLYAEFGISLPSIASTQGNYIVTNGLQVNENELRPGDLIFHSRDTNSGEFMSIGHVAIYVGNGMQVDARGTDYGVVYRPLVPSNIGLYGRPCW